MSNNLPVPLQLGQHIVYYTSRGGNLDNPHFYFVCKKCGSILDLTWDNQNEGFVVSDIIFMDE